MRKKILTVSIVNIHLQFIKFSKMNKSLVKKLVLWSLVIVVIGVIVYPKLTDSNITKNETILKQDGKKEIIVNGIVAEYTKINRSVFATGTLLGDEEIELKSEISGRITKMNLAEGTKVKKGDLLIKLNDNDLQAQLKKAIERLKLLELTESRQRQLYEKQGISRQDYDIALSELSTQKAEIDYLKAMVERTEILAPFDGTIGLRYVSEGAYITPTTTIASLQKIDYLKIDFAVPQKYFSNISKGSLLNFKVPPDTNSYEVSVLAVEPKIDEMTRTFKIRGRFNNSQKNLIPGSYAEVTIITDENPNTFLIPSISLIPDLESEYVLLYQNGKAVKRNVRTGVRNPEQIEIISGISIGDTIITSGIMQVKPGDALKVEVTNIAGRR